MMTDYQIVWRGQVSYTIGGGTACGEYILALDRLGVDIKIDDAFIQDLPEEDPSKTRRFHYLMNKPYANDKLKILIYDSPPYDIDTKMERKRFDYLMLNTVWETTRIPSHWFPKIKQFDAVCVPSKQNIAALKNSGVRIPTFLVPHGAEPHFFKPENKKLPIRGAEGRFIFVSVFDFQHRKNPEGLLRAYWEEFKPDDKVMLLIKTHWCGNGNMGHQIRENIWKYKCKLGVQGRTAPIVLLTNTLSRKEISGVYTLGHTFVLPTRGEGVGLPFIEALSSGIPVIATGWGGQMDFLNKRNSFLVNYQLEYPGRRMDHAISPVYRSLFDEKGQLWAEPDLKHLKKLMRHAYKNPELCKIKGWHGRRDMLNFSWDRGGVALKEAIEKTIKK